MMIIAAICTLMMLGQPSAGGTPAATPAVAPQPVAVDAPMGLDARVHDLNRRLESLTPSQPRGYFELGEEVAAEAATESDRRLARDLYILALELSRPAAPSGDGKSASSAPPTTPPAAPPPPDLVLARSVCLALAAMESADEQRRWLIALADSTGADLAAEPAQIRSTTTSRDPAAFDLASALGLIRIGEGRRAQAILSKPGVAALLERVDKLLSSNFGGGADQVRRNAEAWPSCPRCLNRRYVKEVTSGGGSSTVVCPHCLGTPGARLRDADLLAQIRTESVLLSGQARSWAAQIVSDGGGPLRELDIDELARVFSVDPARPLWRNGQWMPVRQVQKAPAASRDG